MLATKGTAGKAVEAELSIDLHRAEPGLPDDVGYRRSGNLRTISESLDGRTIRDTAAHPGLLRCKQPMEREKHFCSAMTVLLRGKRASPSGWFN